LRLVILGCAGAGTTTLAKRLAERTGARLILLDAIWREDWTDADVPAFRGADDRAARRRSLD
jgi:adenylate kinase family enzyme